MRDYLYSDLKTIEVINVDHHQININGITIFNIDELHFQEFEDEYVVMRFLIENKEIASMNILQNEKLICDEDNNYFIIPIEGMDF
jgi:hypothetical protein